VYFVREDLSFNKTDTLLHCAEQTLEVCATELETESPNLRILALYRAPSENFNQFIYRVPSENFNQFIKRIDATLKYLYNSKSEFLICGDINVDISITTVKKLIINNIQFVSYCTFCY
jgi:hypothetical protein